ncbi:MAG TPA: tRNA(Met) cytidine acetyltransferase, partial [Pseudoalteromonas sp.]|nr:tRNA(Met) cytidine acetyltransferase [Pseudoalteromonas sp.]
MHDFKLYKHCVEQLTQQLTGAKHRQLVLITGQPTWCYELLSALTRSDDVKLLSSSLANASWPEHTHQLLGQEFP